MSEQQLSEYRMNWCRKWLKRASELRDLEKRDLASRPPHVQMNTASKRLLLTAEILQEIGYEDPLYKPCLQLEPPRGTFWKRRDWSWTRVGLRGLLTPFNWQLVLLFLEGFPCDKDRRSGS
ncbi:unnamed protein product [Durusdinium trenchii]|uniref:Uncharacterized protein n=1 Tax=Durusdinium trenchii TaxID=1381693 RepID=A0ABP0SKJ7_9DINO